MKQKLAGFTLIEVLVATVISVGMLTLVMASFWTLWQTYRTADLMREMQHETTFAMTRIADKIRAQSLDYPAYISPDKCQPNQNHRLCLQGDHYFEYLDENLLMGNYESQSPLFSTEKFTLTRLYFSKSPDQAPTRTNTDNQFQPQVSIELELVSKRDIWGRSVEPEEALKLRLQTTISSRNYDF